MEHTKEKMQLLNDDLILTERLLKLPFWFTVLDDSEEEETVVLRGNGEAASQPNAQQQKPT